MSSLLRRRHAPPSTPSAESVADPQRRPPRPPRPPRGPLFATLLLIAGTVALVAVRNQPVPIPAPGAIGAGRYPVTSPLAHFSAQRAMRHVKVLAPPRDRRELSAAAKPRSIGSPKLTSSMAYVKRELERLVDLAADRNLNLDVDFFAASGSFKYSFLKGTTSINSYANIPSIVARLAPHDATLATPSLLVNAHVDSVHESPGATDNALAVGVVLESIRALLAARPAADGGSSAPPQLVRPVVFLFNGCEEYILAGAHAFFSTPHRWAASVAAHVNLESMGSGDAYLLYRMGGSGVAGDAGDHGERGREESVARALATVYARAVTRPRATVTGVDLMALKVVPADTDYGMFEEYGVPGYDFAIVDNGRVYHTRYDDFERASVHAAEHGGRHTVLPLVLHLVGENDGLARIVAARDGKKTGTSRLPLMQRAVFFDVYGRVAVAYPELVAVLANLALVVVAIVHFARPLVNGSTDKARRIVSQRLRMILVLGVATVAAFAAAFALVVVYLVLMDRPMSWFWAVEMALMINVPMAFIGVSWALRLALPSQSKMSPNEAHDAMIFAVSTVLIVLVVALTVAGFLTAYIPALMLLMLLAYSMTQSRLPWPLQLLLIHIPIVGLSAGSAHTWLAILLGLMGRAGEQPSDFIVAANVVFLAVFYWVWPLLPLYVKQREGIVRVRKLSRTIAIVTLLFVWMLPEFTLPHRNIVYSIDAPKRIIALHFYAPEMDPPQVLAIAPMDRIPVDMRTTIQRFPFSQNDALGYEPVSGAMNNSVGECLRLYRRFVSGVTLFRVDTPIQLPVPTAKLVDEVQDEHDPSLRHLTIAFAAPQAYQLTVRLKSIAVGGVVRQWSLDAPMIDLGDGEGCWIRHVGRAEDGALRLQFTVVVGVDPGTDQRPVVPVVVTSMKPGDDLSEPLSHLSFPLWTAPVLLQTTGATYEL